MGGMQKKFWMALVVVAAGVLLASGVARAQADEDDYDGPMAHMHFLVLKDYNGKPVKNAAVVLHPVTKKGQQAKGGLELKTDTEGRTSIEGIPYGQLRVQVLAPGYQTFGEDYEVNKGDMLITVKLKRPTGQYSVYGQQPQQSGEQKADPNKKPQ